MCIGGGNKKARTPILSSSGCLRAKLELNTVTYRNQPCPERRIYHQCNFYQQYSLVDRRN